MARRYGLGNWSAWPLGWVPGYYVSAWMPRVLGKSKSIIVGIGACIAANLFMAVASPKLHFYLVPLSTPPVPVLPQVPPPTAPMHVAAEAGSPPADNKLVLGDDYFQFLDCVDYDPTPVDLLVERTRLTPQEVSSMLLQLELGGYVSSVSGGRYTRTVRNSK